MQYLLTQEEYDALKKHQKIQISLEKKKLQQLCTKIADTMPISVKWRGNGNPMPWNCIKSIDDEWYCDKCPVQDICPEEWKSYSK